MKGFIVWRRTEDDTFVNEQDQNFATLYYGFCVNLLSDSPKVQIK